MSDAAPTSSSNSNDNKEQGISSQKLNLILAICAILISAASFYATYLQANAAEKQVKAMTLPLLQFESSNLDEKTNKPVIKFAINNGGVGPALIKRLQLSYKNKNYQNIFQVIDACCASEHQEFSPKASMNLSQGGFITSTVVGRILPAQQKINFYQLYDGKVSHKFWNKLNDERRYLKVSVCYCSLLDECYLTTEAQVVKSVASCVLDE